MFRIGTFMFIPAYLSVILYRPFHNVHPDDSNILLMSGMSDFNHHHTYSTFSF